jgi:hypothetical protein
MHFSKNCWPGICCPFFPFPKPCVIHKVHVFTRSSLIQSTTQVYIFLYLNCYFVYIVLKIIINNTMNTFVLKINGSNPLNTCWWFNCAFAYAVIFSKCYTFSLAVELLLLWSSIQTPLHRVNQSFRICHCHK